MSERSVVHNTFVLERSFPKPPGRVFAAFSDPAKMRRWLAEGETHEVEEFQVEFRVGGTERSRYRLNERTPFPGTLLGSDGIYLDIQPDRRIVIASTMTLGERCISAALVTFELVRTEAGTDLIFTHQAAFFEGADGPQLREAGWSQLLDQLSAELARE